MGSKKVAKKKITRKPKKKALMTCPPIGELSRLIGDELNKRNIPFSVDDVRKLIQEETNTRFVDHAEVLTNLSDRVTRLENVKPEITNPSGVEQLQERIARLERNVEASIGPLKG